MESDWRPSRQGLERKRELKLPLGKNRAWTPFPHPKMQNWAIQDPAMENEWFDAV